MYQIQLNNDVFFKWLLSSGDEGSRYLLDVIIKGATGISYQSLQVTNPDIIPDYNLAKEIILDVLVEDDIGRKIDIEMQMTTLSRYQIKRFIYYSCRMVTSQIKRGEEYEQLHDVFHIIFVDEMFESFMERYDLRDKEGKEIEDDLIHIILISLPYLNRNKKDIKQMNELELMVYMFKNNLNHDILKVKKKVVDIMEHKFHRFTEEEKIAYYAMQRELGRQDIENRIKEGHEEGLKQGLQQGMYAIVLTMFRKKFPHEDDSFLKQCSEDQLQEISERILDNQGIKNIMMIIK